MNFITNFEKILQNTQTEELVLDDVVGDVLKISFLFIVILFIVLVLVYNFYIAYFNKK